jgi:hypothetical protein
VRQAIRDRILAADLAGVLLAARSIHEIQAVLEDAADDLGFLAMSVATGPETAALLEAGPQPGGPAWTLDFPLCDHQDGDAHLVLRIRARVSNGVRPHGGERVAHVLGSALRARLRSLQIRCGDGRTRNARTGDGARVGPADRITAALSA